MSLTTIVPRDNYSMRQLFLATIFPRNNYSSIPLQIVICKEDSPPDDQNQGDGGAQIVANDHPDDSASSVLLRSFANDHLQRRQSSRWPTFFWSDEAEIRTRPAPSMEDPQYKISAKTDQRVRS